MLQPLGWANTFSAIIQRILLCSLPWKCRHMSSLVLQRNIFTVMHNKCQINFLVEKFWMCFEKTGFIMHWRKCKLRKTNGRLKTSFAGDQTPCAVVTAVELIRTWPYCCCSCRKHSWNNFGECCQAVSPLSDKNPGQWRLRWPNGYLSTRW